MDKTRLTSKSSQEIRTEMRISNVNLKGDLFSKIYVWVDIPIPKQICVLSE